MMPLAPLLPCPWIPHGMPLVKAPRTMLPIWEGPGLKSQPNHLLVNPDWEPNQGPRKDRPSKLPHRWISVEMSRLGTHNPPLVEGDQSQQESLLGRPVLWRKATIARSNILCYGRWQLSGCQLPSRRPLNGGMPHPGLVGFTPKILCLSLMPLTPRTYGLWGRRRPWPWPRHYRPVLKNLGPQQAIYARPCESFRDVLPPWWPSVGMT